MKLISDRGAVLKVRGLNMTVRLGVSALEEISGVMGGSEGLRRASAASKTNDFLPFFSGRGGSAATEQKRGKNKQL